MPPDPAAGTPLTAIRGIGPAQAALLRAAGVDDAETLHALGADAAYARMLSAGARPHFIPFYALHMALQGRPWNDCKGDEKAALRARYDALLAEHAAGPDSLPAALARFLDDLGIRAPLG
ncbi:hypothetical protein ROJ8625_01315 [Roseivivax jejudonensis]|uniref:TfoX C-terminal domain-containing protein n=1 Tax=Roseivivax jejudonensis TaxID=1529041 RepID=A0A1X6YSE4_9RHOB|nr:TfoX/Sxy family DNA transformation protein [Roseivivax jejudonensis]SLN29749.1 hypothetical protein ROJ8625_01315 [Roseivivax jejudonensis]